MVSARNLLRRHYDTYGGVCSFVDVDTHYNTSPAPAKPPAPSSLRSNLTMMAEHHQSSRTVPQQEETKEEQQPPQTEESDQQVAGTSTIKAAADDSWLQLGIAIPSSSSSQAAAASAAGPSAGPSVELQLFSDKPSSSSTFRRPAVPPPMFSAQLGYRPFWPGNLMSMNASSSMMMMMPPPPQFYNAQRFPPPPAVESGPHFGGELRVVSPPARQQSNCVWFHLRAADNQVREPFLPQIPKSYIRIKDGRMTVRLLMKYLAKKLGLDDESEVLQISCRGQPLPPYLTIQHARDHIWCRPSESIACVSESPAADHVMTLHYGRCP